MLEKVKDYGGAIFFYFILFFGVVAICTKVDSMNNLNESENKTENTIAISK